MRIPNSLCCELGSFPLSEPFLKRGNGIGHLLIPAASVVPASSHEQFIISGDDLFVETSQVLALQIKPFCVTQGTAAIFQP